MSVNYKILKDKLEQYYLGEIEKSELGIWAARKYYDIITGSYVITESIAVYKFLKILSEINIVPNDIKDEYPCSPEEIRNIYEILCGNINETHTICVKIPLKIYNHNHNLNLADWEEKAAVKKILTHLSENQILTYSETETLKALLNKPLATPQSLLNLLEIQMKSLLSRILHCNNRSSFGLYISRSEFSDTQAISDLEKALACYIGEKSFNVCVVYLSGVPNISLII